MALMTVTPGTRILGGLSAPRTSAAEQFQAGLQANLTRQDTKQAMRAREQAMELAQSEEARRQAAFEQQQAAAARAAAARAQQQRAFDEYTQSLRTAPEVPAAGVRRPVADFRTPTTEGAFPLVPTTPRAGITLPGVLPAAPAAAPATPLVGPRIAGGGGSDVLGGGAGADVLGTRLEQAAQTLVAAGMSREQVQQYIDRGIDLNYLLAQLPTGAPPVPGPAATEVERINLGSTTGTPLYNQLVELLPPATTGAPERTPPERTGEDPFITEQETEAGPIAGLTPAGQRDPIAATEAAVRAAPERDISKYFMSNPNLTLDLQTQMARERQMLEARLRYAETTQNMALYDQTFADLNSRERLVNENMVNGQIAILAAQQDNFGPLQEFMNRAYPNDNVEVIPYTNGTVSFFVNGREDGEPIPVADLLDGMARTFNAEYREALAAAAAQQAEREQFLFENATLEQLRAAREISVEQAKALAEIETQYGQVDVVGDLASGDKLFQTLVPGRGYVQFRIVEAGQPLVNGQPAPAATVEEVPQVSPLR